MAIPNNQNSYYLSQSGPNQKNSKIKQGKDYPIGAEPDYNYNINGVGGSNNPLLASVNT